jgi:predicted nucleic-acid-binding Zn-ribbon protein
MIETCPKCGSEKTKEILGLGINFPKEIRDRLMEWSEFECLSCGTKFVDGKLII